MVQILFLQGVKLTSEQFNAIFTYYDKVGEGLFKLMTNDSRWLLFTRPDMMLLMIVFWAILSPTTFTI